MATFVDSQGRGDDFSATATCTALACGWTHTETLSDDGDFEQTVLRAEQAASEHTHPATPAFRSGFRRSIDQRAFDIDEDRFGPQD